MRGQGTRSADALVEEAEALADVASLVEAYPMRTRRGVPVRQRSLSLLERSLRRNAARHVLNQLMPDLVAELLDAAADDLDDSPDRGPEAHADAELRLVEAVESCKAALDAAGLEALARLRSCIESAELGRVAGTGGTRPSGWLDADELTVLEVTTATGLGPQEVHDRLGLATARSSAAAELRDRLRSGAVSLHRARVLHAEVRHLEDAAAVGVVDSTLRPKDGAPPSPTLFRQRLTRACVAADRDAARRRRDARRRRGAFARIDADGLGVLTVTNDADKIVAAMERADALARAARQAGDRRSLDVLRADAITDLLVLGSIAANSGAAEEVSVREGPDDAAWRTLLGRRPSASVTLVVPLPVALGHVDAPCEVPGHGWVGPEQARRMMLHPASRWRMLAVDPSTGAATAVGTTAYRPTASMRAVVEAVDGTCRGPGCTVPAARCDLDHDIPWPHGPTEVTNLTSKHRLHHNARTHGHWSASRDPDARVHWRTAAGRRYVTEPKDWLEDLRPPPEPARRPRVIDELPPF
jgi:hypothetical protein